MSKYLTIIFIGLVFIESIQSQSSSISDHNWFSIGEGIGSKKMISNFISYTFNGDNIWQRSLNGNQEFSFFKSRDYIVSTTFAYGEKADWSFILSEVFYGSFFCIWQKERRKD